MSDRTLVKVYADRSCIGFQIVSRQRKTSQRFIVTRTELQRLERENCLISRDLHSFAVFRLKEDDQTLTIDFTWLRSGNAGLTGYEETVILPYEGLAAFVQESLQEGGPQTWRVLSIQRTMEPHIEFRDKPALCRCLANRTVKKKLTRALRDCFRGYERVVLYRDYIPYSFYFQTYLSGKPYICGGLILHDQENLKKAHYSIHT